MRLYAETLGLPDAAFGLLRDLIQKRAGLFYENSRRDLLADRLSPCVVDCGFDPFLDYYYFLKYDPDAEAEWGRVLGVVMSGMGSDGKQGAAWIKSQGGTIFTEAEETCVVYGMPRSVLEAGLSDKSVALDELAQAITEAV